MFHDAEARNKLNAIVHPQVRRLLSERIAGLQHQGTKVVVAEVSLLIEAIRSESEWTRMFDQIWVVDRSGSTGGRTGPRPRAA